MTDSDRDYVYYPGEKAMVFSTEREHHVRVAYSGGEVWYCVSDVARLFGYTAKERTIDRLDCEIKLLHVPHVRHSHGFTNCNCFAKDDLLEFISRPRARRDLRAWITDVVIPQAEEQLLSDSDLGKRPQVFEIQNKRSESVEDAAKRMTTQSVDILDALDEIIIKAALLKREFQLIKNREAV
jgi:prophage antirepressor-like protein